MSGSISWISARAATHRSAVCRVMVAMRCLCAVKSALQGAIAVLAKSSITAAGSGLARLRLASKPTPCIGNAGCAGAGALASVV